MNELNESGNAKGGFTGTCRLCLSVRPLCKSHIIPEFIFLPMYDEKHRYYVLSVDPTVNRCKPPQKGVRERLLCTECEQRLSMHEKYVSELLYGGQEFYGKKEGNLLILSGLNYMHIRLCYLSILWKMGISTNRMFRDVNLGPHEDKLRNMILDDRAGEPHEYGFICIVPFNDDKALPALILQPERIRVQGLRCYRVIIGGLILLFYTSSHRLPSEQERAFIQKDGTWVFFRRDIKQLEFLERWLTAVF